VRARHDSRDARFGASARLALESTFVVASARERGVLVDGRAGTTVREEFDAHRSSTGAGEGRGRAERRENADVIYHPIGLKIQI
jgi:hypothetical protein|tara:strand:+ start:3636 stop:3887 length:252 start_codon:yes stop_codon:yes gene_type:complete